MWAANIEPPAINRRASNLVFIFDLLPQPLSSAAYDYGGILLANPDLLKIVEFGDVQPQRDWPISTSRLSDSGQPIRDRCASVTNWFSRTRA
jgi:hypothetical protein